jgi:hypothetical protein
MDSVVPDEDIAVMMPYGNHLMVRSNDLFEGWIVDRYSWLQGSRVVAVDEQERVVRSVERIVRSIPVPSVVVSVFEALDKVQLVGLFHPAMMTARSGLTAVVEAAEGPEECSD